MAEGPAPRLAVDVGAGLRLKNPVIAAAGTFGYGVEFAGVVDLAVLGAIVVKGLSLPFPICPDFIEVCPIR